MRRQLAQTRPADTSAATALQSAAPWEVDLILIANTTSTQTSATIYHDADGTTYDDDTVIVPAILLDGNSYHWIEFPKGIVNTNGAGSLGVKSGTGDAINFTIYGEIDGERV